MKVHYKREHPKELLEMTKLIVGPKGHNKTSRLIDLVNTAADTSKGSVICIEKVSVSQFLVSSKVRLIDIDEYDISSYENFYSFICGLIASNYDITDIFVDSTLRIGGRDLAALDAFIAKINALSEKSGIQFTFTISSEHTQLMESTLSACDATIV